MSAQNGHLMAFAEAIDGWKPRLTREGASQQGERNVAASTLALAFAIQAVENQRQTSKKSGDRQPMARIRGPIWSFLAHIDRLSDQGRIKLLGPAKGLLSRRAAFDDVAIDIEMVREGADDSILLRCAGLPSRHDGSVNGRKGPALKMEMARSDADDRRVRALHGIRTCGGVSGWREFVGALDALAVLYDEPPDLFLLSTEFEDRWASCEAKLDTFPGDDGFRDTALPLQPVLDHLVAACRPSGRTTVRHFATIDRRTAGPIVTKIAVERTRSATLAASRRITRGTARNRLATMLASHGACEHIIGCLGA